MKTKITFLALSLFMFAACGGGEDNGNDSDTTPPAEVTGISGVAGDGQVTLNWTDPTDSDFAKVEITYTQTGTAIEVAKGVQTAVITGLTNGTAYTFTVKTVDATGNKSGGVNSSPYTPVATQEEDPGDDPQPTASVPLITLNNGLQMPQLGLGTYDQGSNETARQSVLTALRAGYRKIDSAHLYYTEEGVGQAIKESGIPREEIWVTSKLATTDYNSNNTMASIDAMLARLQLDYVDLLYIHHPEGQVEAAWPVMEEAVRQGKVRSLGLSNFDRNTALLQRIMEIAEIKPVTIQVECHPYRQLPEFRKLVAEYGLQMETWFPLGGTMSGGAILREPIITAIAAVHGKSAAQVILRWHMQMGFCTFPGARRADYIEENIQIFDFELTADEMAQIESINRNRGIFNTAYYE